MPSIHYLNPPPHPFWDFVAGLEDHPLFAAYNPSQRAAGDTNPTANQAEQSGSAQATQVPSETARGKQTAADDPPEVDPSSVRPDLPDAEHNREFPFRGRGRHGPGEGSPRGRGAHCRGRGGRGGPFGPHGWPGSPFGFGQHPFWAGPRHQSRPHRHHQHGPPGPPRHEDGERRQPEGERGFDLGQFLNGLGDRLGVDLAGAADNLGVSGYNAPRKNEDSDFEPRTDIFDTPNHYDIHLSLPGAKKEDVGVDWDGENSILRITGVVHRPGVDEQMLAQLVVDGRKRENGVFEKAIRLGTKRDPASVDVAGITAKMSDGILLVRVPKVEKKVEKREVHISGSASPNPARGEKDLLFDADEEMYDAAPERQPEAAVVTSRVPAAESATEKPKEEEARDDRSETVAHEEQLPRYQAEQQAEDVSDWEKDSEEEADYVKINVN